MLAYAQMRKLRMLRMGELTGPLQLSGAQERELFRRLLRGGIIARVRPGLFLVPPRLPLGGAWTPDEAEALNALMKEVKGRYQICGANTFNRYGFDDQIPNRVYAYNNRISGERKIGAVEMILIKVADDRLGDTVEIGLEDAEKAVYASRARSLVDAVYDLVAVQRHPARLRVDSPGVEGEAGERGGVGALHVALWRHGHDPTDGRVAGTRGRGGKAVAEAGGGVAADEQPDSVGSHATEAGNAEPPLGRGDER